MNNKLSAALGLVGCLAIGAVLWAGIVYNANLVNDPELAYSQNYSLNLATTPNQAGIKYLSAQASISSATVAAQGFTDGQLSTGSITVAATTNLAAQAATNQITVGATATILAASATNYLVVLTTQSLTGKTVTYNGNPLVGGTAWTIVDTTSGTANNIKTAINRFSGVHATRTNDEVDLTITAAGATGNTRTLAVNTSSITIGGAHFGGGHNNRIVNGVFTLKGLKYPQGSGWQAQATSSGTATNIAAWLNRQSGIKASAAASVVYATATTAGTAGNGFTLASSAPSYLTVAGASFSGGRDNANVCVNGTCVTQGTGWTAQSTTTGTANAISDALMAKSAISSIIASTWTAAGVVSATSTATNGSNYAMTTNDSGDLTLSGATMTGGSASAYATGGNTFTISDHGFTTGLAITVSSSTAVAPVPLKADNTTVYYVGRVNANTVAISSTQAQAIAGTYITMGTASKAGPHTFSFNPKAISGTGYLVWQASNDCANWFNMNVSSITFASPYTAASYNWDFAQLNYKCVRAAVTAPTTGALNLVAPVVGSN